MVAWEVESGGSDIGARDRSIDSERFDLQVFDFSIKDSPELLSWETGEIGIDDAHGADKLGIGSLLGQEGCLTFLDFADRQQISSWYK